MSLLVDMTASALEPSYAEAAARRKTSTGPRRPLGDRPPRRRLPLPFLSLVVLFGILTGVAVAQERQSARQTSVVRQSLVADVRDQTGQTDRLAQRASTLRANVSRVRDAALGEDARGRAVAADVAALELVTGGTAVHGPGVLVTLNDAVAPTDASVRPRGGQLGDGRIFDRDLQAVVNALWAAGAEAISINGMRLTVRTAIRSAGEAVLVDFRPLSPPYLVRAVGDVDRMEPAFVDSPTARRFNTWISLYGLGFRVARVQDLQLPAAGALELRLVRPGGTP